MQFKPGSETASASPKPRVAALVATVLSDPAQLQRVVEAAISAGEAASVELEVVCVLNDPRLVPPELAPARLITAGMNLGYAGGLQLARIQTTAGLLWVLQDDMLFEPQLLGHLLETLTRHSKAGVVAPVASDPDTSGLRQVRGGFVTAQGTLTTVFPKVYPASETIDERTNLNWLALAGALVPAAAWDAVGGPDASFFPLQQVDVEFGFRLSKAGYKMVVSPNAAIDHEFGGSSAGLMKRFLNQDASQRFAAKHTGKLKRAAGANTPSLAAERVTAPPALLEQVAVSASLGFVDLARFADQEVKQLQGELAAASGGSAVPTDQLELRAELQNMRSSISWRITAPLRWLGRVVQRFRG